MLAAALAPNSGIDASGASAPVANAARDWLGGFSALVEAAVDGGTIAAGTPAIAADAVHGGPGVTGVPLPVDDTARGGVDGI